MSSVLPFWRNAKVERSGCVEVMADSMRVGKTTAVKVVGEGMRKRGYSVVESYEDWEHNPYLKSSYVDPEKNFLESQKWFAKRKWEQLSEPKNTDILIQDVSPEMDYNYAKTNLRLGRMNKQSFEEYDEFFRSLNWNEIGSPGLLIYLEVSDDELIRRAMDSRREFEEVDPSYFLMMKRVNREWLNHALAKTAYRILRIDTDELDFAHDLAAKEELTKLVVDKLAE